MIAQSLFESGLIVWVVGAVVCLGLWLSPEAARKTACATALVGSLLQLAASTVALLAGGIAEFSLPFGNPIFSWTVRIDPLSAFFTLILAILASAVSLYSFGYLKHMEGRRNLGAFGSSTMCCCSAWHSSSLRRTHS